MPSNKRRSSTGGLSTPSKPPLPCSSSSGFPSDGRLSTPPPVMAAFCSPQMTKAGVSEIQGSGTPTSDGKFKCAAGGFKATVVAVDDKDVKGRAMIWLSEQTMLSAPIATGSLVSVSILAPTGDAGIIHWSSDSVRELSITHCGVEMHRSDTSGAVMAVAIAWPSRKLVKNEVRFSRVLAYSLGTPALGTSISLKALKCQSLNADQSRASVERQDPNGAMPAVVQECTHLSLRWCPPQTGQTTHSYPVLRSFPSYSKDELLMCSPSMQTPKRQSHQESERGSVGTVSSSPAKKSPFPGNTKSPMQGESPEKTSTQEIKTEAQVLQNWSSVWASFEKGKEKVRSLLEGFAARWLAGRYLLPGNIVQIPVCGCDCMMLVTETETSMQLDNSKGNLTPSSSNANNEDTMICALTLTDSSPPLVLYLMSLNTKVTLLPPVKAEDLGVGPQSNMDTSATLEAFQEDTLKGVGADVDRIEYSALGGLSAQIEKLRQQVELSLLHPQHLTRYGLQPVRGILLHGPPGTGKSSLARAAACEAGVKMFAINGPEIISEFYGESESALRETFKLAMKEGPSVVFIDELDAIVPERKEGGEELGQRLVAALLTVMDGGAEDTLKGVLVIAATNRIDSIDPALRRPGRFDLEIEIGVPSPSERLGILQVLLRNLRHTLDCSDISELAATTHGFVGADLAALCNEAALSTLRRNVHLRRGNLEKNASETESAHSISQDFIETQRQPSQGVETLLEVALQDFQVAKTKVRPSAMREVALEVPKVRWSDIGGHDDVKQKLKEIVEWPQKESAAIARMGVDPPHGVLLHGPPGCSKTLMARAVASETGLNFIGVKGPELFSKWVGESEKAVKTLFARARAAAPSVVFFDEIDGLAVKRDNSHGAGVSVGDRVMSQLLTEMDGLVPMKGISVIAATNRLDIIDSALLRPGRFDRILYVGPPDEKARRQIFDIHLAKMPCSPDVSRSDLATKTVSYTGADISALCREAAMIALEENVDAKEVQMCHFDTAIGRIKPSRIGTK